MRVSSDRPISVAEVESDDDLQPATSSSGTVVLPLQSLGSNFRAVTYPQEATHDVQQAVGSRGGAARVIVVRTQPGTRISFKPVAAVSEIRAPGSWSRRWRPVNRWRSRSTTATSSRFTRTPLTKI